MPSYKLTYFNSRGVAENSRLLFKLAGQEFEDVRIAREDWPKFKADMPLQALPVLEIDGVRFCQSNAIAKYLAKAFGFMGADLIEELKINELGEVLAELFNKHVVPMFYETDEEKKKELFTKLVKENLPTYLNFIDKKLKANGGRYYVGKSITYADTSIFCLFEVLKAVFAKREGGNPFDGQAALKEHFDRISAEPKIAAWIKERPETDF